MNDITIAAPKSGIFSHNVIYPLYLRPVRHKIYILILFLLQCLLVLKGRYWFGMNGNPVLLLCISLLLAAVFVQRILNKEQISATTGTQTTHWPGFIAGGLGILILIPWFMGLFTEYPKPENSSDVIPQLDALYTRWKAGIFPYYPLESVPWHPYPVYMPLNWLPLAVPHWLGIDVRWIGIFITALANAGIGWYVWKSDNRLIIKILAIFLVPVLLGTYLLWGRFDIAVSLETLIAGYYLILALGLITKNLWLTTLGIILCLLSRYTLVFWLPLFAGLLWINRPLKVSLWVWISVLSAVVILYIIPFYSHDTSILSKGVAYHNHCAIAEWEGFGDPEYKGSFDSGISFAWLLKNILRGTMEHRVFVARAIQAVLMLLLCTAGFAAYKKWKERISFYDMGLVSLYLIVLVFYLFSPLVYRYYYIPLLSLSAVLCIVVVTSRSKAKK